MRSDSKTTYLFFSVDCSSHLRTRNSRAPPLRCRESLKADGLRSDHRRSRRGGRIRYSSWYGRPVARGRRSNRSASRYILKRPLSIILSRIVVETLKPREQICVQSAQVLSVVLIAVFKCGRDRGSHLKQHRK